MGFFAERKNIDELMAFDSLPTALVYSPSPECPVACHGDEWRGEPAEALAKAGYLAMASSAILFRMPRGSTRGGSLAGPPLFPYSNTFIEPRRNQRDVSHERPAWGSP